MNNLNTGASPRGTRLRGGRTLFDAPKRVEKALRTMWGRKAPPDVHTPVQALV